MSGKDEMGFEDSGSLKTGLMSHLVYLAWWRVVFGFCHWLVIPDHVGLLYTCVLV